MKKGIIQAIALFIAELILLFPVSAAVTLSDVQSTGATTDSATIKWKTNDYATSIVKYGKGKQLSMIETDSRYLFQHAITLTGLDGDTEYYYAVESIDINGTKSTLNNSNSLYKFKTLDNVAPAKVLNLTLDNSGTDSISLKWANVNASDLKYYHIYRGGILVANTTQASYVDTGLQSSKTYTYAVSAADATGNEGLKSDSLSVSTQKAASAVLKVSAVSASGISDSSASITWSTNLNATSAVYYWMNSSFSSQASDPSYVESHNISVTGLGDMAIYGYKVLSCDQSGQCMNSTAYAFTTLSAGNSPNSSSKLSLNVTLPAYSTKKVIDISGTVKPYSTVKLFVNNMASAARVLSPSDTSGGRLKFYNVALSSSNVIKFSCQNGNDVLEKSFNVIVDAQNPSVTLNSIPSLLTKNNLTLKGTVSEPVTLKVYHSKGNKTAPAMIEGLDADMTNRSVKLSWNKSTESDFSHYVIYRDDIGAIATAKPASYNSYEDLLVNNGEIYKYEVSAVNSFGIEGSHSDYVSVSVSVPGGNSTNIMKPALVGNATSVQARPLVNEQVNSSFSRKISLSEGSNFLRIEFSDKAGNMVVFEKEIFLDTKKPDLEITRPKSGSFIYENYADSIDISGTTEAYADVHLYVGRTPFSSVNASFSVSGIAGRLENIASSDLAADTSIMPKRTYNQLKADYSTRASDSGDFELYNIDLTSAFGLGGTITEQSLSDYSRESQYKQASDILLLFVASDQSGLKAVKDVKYRIGTCWSGNMSWDVSPLVEYQSPSLLSVERLRENTEELFFYLNYTYVGRGGNGKITRNGVSITKACGDLANFGKDRFNTSCKVLPDGTRTVVNPEGTASYTSVKLNRISGMEKWLKNDWEGFFKAVSKELTFPFVVKITYEHDVGGKVVRETQTTCLEVTYVVDNSLIDPRSVLPDWVLYDFVNLLNSSINGITKVQEQLKTVITYTAYGCMASWMLHIVTGTIRRFVTFTEERKITLQKVTGFEGLNLGLGSAEDEDYCKNVLAGVGEKYKLGKDFAGFKLKYLSDYDLNRCFPSVSAWWNNEAMLYKSSRLTCDRIFGHPSPAKWTESISDDTLYEKKQSGVGCSKDQSVMGKPLLVVKCLDIAKTYTGMSDPNRFSQDDKCFSVQGKNELGQQTETLYTLSAEEDKVNKIYKAKTASKTATLITKYVIKQTDNQYLTAQDKTCAQVCGITKIKEARPEAAIDTEYEWQDPNQAKDNVKEKQDDKLKTYFKCMPVQECRVLKDRKDVNADIKFSVPKGYTADCFYKADINPKVESALASPDSVSDDPEKRYECCCINAIKAPASQYYTFSDKVAYTVKDRLTQQPAFQSKKAFAQLSSDSQSGIPASVAKEPTPAESYIDMSWSYRYWKEKFQTQAQEGGSNSQGITIYPTHYEYNPDRYIEGRDWYACFGQNSWLDKKYGILSDSRKAQEDRLAPAALAEDGKKPLESQDVGSTLILDPAKDHLAAFQCLHLSGIYNRLQIIKNIMSALSSCLVSVRTTGVGDSGVCKELFTQYLCSVIWNIIQLFLDGCLPFGHGISLDASNNDVVAYMKNGFQSVWGSISDKQNELASEYGNAKLNNLLGAGEDQLARKICLLAFGYDWDFTLDNVIDSSYASPYSTLVQGTTATREYLTVDPQSGKARYEYRGSWLVNPGCDLSNYKVELACVSRNEMAKYEDINCQAVKDPSGNNCDCMALPSEKLTPFYSKSKQLGQGVLDTPSHHSIVSSDYRYDHLKITLYADSKIKSSMKSKCFPEGHEDGVFYYPLRDKTAADIAACSLDITTAQFKCSQGTSFWTTQGRAYFSQLMVEINGQVINARSFFNASSPASAGVSSGNYYSSSSSSSTININKGDKVTIMPYVNKLDAGTVCLIAKIRQGTATASRYETVNAVGEYPVSIPLDTAQITRSGGVYPGRFDSCEPTNECAANTQNWGIKVKPVSMANTDKQQYTIEFVDSGNDGITLKSTSNDKIIVNRGEEQVIREIWQASHNGAVIKLADGGSFAIIYLSSISPKITRISFNAEIDPVTGTDQGWQVTLTLTEPARQQATAATQKASASQPPDSTQPALAEGTRLVSTGDCSQPGSQLANSIGNTGETINLVISSTASSDTAKPKISFTNTGGSVYDPGADFTIPFTVTDNYGILKVRYKVSAPAISTSSLKDITNLGLGDDQVRKDYEIKFSPACDNAANCVSLQDAGKYTLTIEVQDMDSKKNIVTQSTQFDVYCKGQNNGNAEQYGICKTSSCAGKELNKGSGIKCASTSTTKYTCCEEGTALKPSN